MFFLKETFLKGLCGASLCGGVAYTGFHFKGQVGKFVSDTFFPESEQDLLDGVGLDCRGWENNQNGSVCSKKNNSGNIKIKKEDDTSIEINEIPVPGGKIKLYKAQDSDGYFKNLKFVIEDGDVGSNTNKLEQFETYEITKENKGFYLSRKKKALDEKKRILGLHEECNLPTESGTPSQCEDLDLEKIKGLAFDARGEGSLTLTESAKVNLTITKLDGNDSNFPLGYKFAFQGNGSDATLTWSGNNKTITFKSGESTEYRILMRDGNQLTLEEAWDQNTLTSNVGLTCTGGNPTETNGIECNKKDGATDIKVKKENSTFNVSTITGGKIKLYKAQASDGYFKNLKFVIEDNDINGNGNDKLEEFETYEIKKDDTSGTWYLTRKNEAKEFIKKALGLDHCDFPTNGSQDGCDIANEKFKKVKFDGIANNVANGPQGTKLKISKVSGDNTFGKFGYKFVLESTNDAKISNSLTIMANTNTEFKIKKDASNNKALTLEKAWTVATLGKKVGLTCKTEGEKECTLEDGNINVNNGSNENNKFQNLSKKENAEEKKVKYEENAGDHNQGIKFYVEGNDDICLQNGGQDGDDNKKIEKMDTATYEVKKDGEVWYLTKKTATRT